MTSMKTIGRLFRRIGGLRLAGGFIVFYFIACALMLWFDPQLGSYSNALWMGFSIATTIGLGDYTVTSLPARIIAVLLGVYGAVLEACIPGLIASSYLQNMSERRNALVRSHAKELSRLHEMSPQEKAELSRQIRQEKNA